MPKAKISRPQIIQASLQTLASCQSLDQFSMRKVATALHIDASTIYWYFESKQAILQAMADEIAAQISFPDASLAWQTQLTQLFSTIFDVYTTHSHAAELMIATIPSSEVRLTLMNHIIGILVSAGFSEEQGSLALSTIDFFLTGLVMDLSKERQFRTAINNKQAAYLHDQVTQIHQITHDEHLIHMQNSVNNRNSQSAKQQFEAGLKLILKGLLAEKNVDLN
ncbi:TetR/AcrR family transcriptional regulator [Pediococcus ethanolidurans]|uniref:TetR family transcriptional regulator n=1 Tax=Pediococcus ethanolidurans TaxID=319653 RepID=A0A0R2K253_9LACO|nr:TetR/AcrR family transcriptional regulator C-terminal domain-containing protein [Pediococcus ethanolidurans]KRN83682.1 TetR family transcriptional regulator [Pediococcus ethanolidurans]GEN93963.1 TetR family transcriptional regulator [Pediococcus ethanolidurans]SER00112.1 transcriptional regulator, TetR family [Pediococcus ethanolidurans]